MRLMYILAKGPGPSAGTTFYRVEWPKEPTKTLVYKHSLAEAGKREIILGFCPTINLVQLKPVASLDWLPQAH